MNSASNNSHSFWYVIYTKPRWEKKLSDTLRKKGIEQYCPLNRVAKQWHDRKKIVEEPLFASYLFVKIRKDQQAYIKAIPGVINFVYWLGKLAVVKSSEIEAIQSFLAEYKTISIEKTSVSVRLDDSVTITKGPLIHREGRIVQVNNNSVKIEIPSIGYALIAQVSKTHILKKVFSADESENSKLYQNSIFGN
ncbi:MAG: UpxY family transcription antiterminator [Chitinophagaceae bacterium]|nr:UpxY family transcription antiterminator [Chitinophagaceae bacterium]